MFSTSSTFGDLRSQQQGTTPNRPTLQHASTSIYLANAFGATPVSTSNAANTSGNAASTSHAPLTTSQLPTSWSSTLNANSSTNHSSSTVANVSTSNIGGGSDSFGASTLQRPTYLPGYLMSSIQGAPLPDGNQRFEDPPTLQNKSSLSAYGRMTPSTFGAESDRHMSQPMDEDAPPTQSVMDTIDSQPFGLHRTSKSLSLARVQASPLPNRGGQPSTPKLQTLSASQEWFEVVVFGYPTEKYGATAKLFTSLGDTTEPEQGPPGSNWFKIGFKNQWDAARAVRKNGELVGGTWMIGVKWADPSQAEAASFVTPLRPLGGQRGYPAGGNTLLSPTSSELEMESPAPVQNLSRTMTTPNFGKSITPLGSGSAFKKRGGGVGIPAAGRDEEDWAAAHTNAVTSNDKKNTGLFGSLLGW